MSPHDAIAAYESTIERLDDPVEQQQVQSFRQDHLNHVAKLEEFARRIGTEIPREGDMKEWLTTGKFAIANLGGSDAVLKAMKTNEDETVQAYEQAATNHEADADMKAFFAAALDDERRHRAWMESRAA